MQWFGKAVGGILGFVTAGPVGSVLGIILGHQLDDRGAFLRGADRPALERISQLFFEVAFEVMGRVAKIDGRVSEDEIRVARAIMHGMQLAPAEVESANKEQAVVHFLDKQDKPLSKVTFGLKEGATVKVDGKDTRVSDLKKGDRVSFYVQHKKWGLYANPDGTAPLTVLSREQM